MSGSASCCFTPWAVCGLQCSDPRHCVHVLTHLTNSASRCATGRSGTTLSMARMRQAPTPGGCRLGQGRRRRGRWPACTPGMASSRPVDARHARHHKCIAAALAILATLWSCQPLAHPAPSVLKHAEVYEAVTIIDEFFSLYNLDWERWKEAFQSPFSALQPVRSKACSTHSMPATFLQAAFVSTYKA